MRWWACEEALFVLVQAGATDEANELHTKWQNELEPDSSLRGPMLKALGRFEEALPFLERSPTTIMSRLYYLPIWDDVRDDPRFQRLISKLGCEAEYKIGRETLGRMV